jgi:hypothetical protein
MPMIRRDPRQSVGPPLEASMEHRTRPQPSEAQRLAPESRWRSIPFKIAAISRLDVGVIRKMQKTV